MLHIVEVAVVLDGQLILAIQVVLVEVEVPLTDLVDLQHNQQQIRVPLNMEIPVEMVMVHIHQVVAAVQVLQEVLMEVLIQLADMVV